MASPLLESLQKANLLPSSILPATFTPTYHLTIHFPDTPKSISNGTLVRVSEVKSTPTVTISPVSTTTANNNPSEAQQPPPASGAATATSDGLTLLLLDPDAPTPDDPKFAYWRHWVVTDIPAPTSSSSPVVVNGTDAAGGGRTITPYLAPGPKDESGPHRYLFLVFAGTAGTAGAGGGGEGVKRLEKADVGGDEFVERRSFGAGEFVRRFGLGLVGVQWMRGVGDGWVGEE
ncbi:PEBP-like protein [Dichotomopilus funicola]|uniref:PEBP-like protein n=1 Tax=Dichotomopilus funicola TaxID=1934379 RepID=A0AAN6ZLA0_9PEZI|nr:PEBP-like protein [Dichotomopilus funicola]